MSGPGAETATGEPAGRGRVDTRRLTGRDAGERPLTPPPAFVEACSTPAPAPGDRCSTPTPAPGERWYCVHTQPRREAWAFENLTRQGFRGWLPLLSRTVRHARRVRTVATALFPRYGFLALDLARDRWRSVNGTFGVVGLIMDGDRPRPVPPGVVDGLQALADGAGIVRYGLEVSVGQKVRVLAGPFAERLATVTRLDERGRVAVLLEILGAERPVILQREQLLPLP